MMPARDSGARRGALLGALLAGALPVYAFLSFDGSMSVAAVLNAVTLGVAAVGAAVGLVCGALAGRMVDGGSTWRRAAAASATTAAVLVLLACWAATGFELSTAPLSLAVPLVLGSTVVATWQSWALQRRADRPRPVAQPA